MKRRFSIYRPLSTYKVKDVVNQRKSRQRHTGHFSTQFKPSRTLPIMRVLGYALVLLLLIMVGNLLRNAGFGIGLILLYGAVAILFRIKSAETFKLALLALGYVMIVALFKNNLLVENFSQYAFMLFVVGCACDVLEQYRENKKSM